MSASQTRPPRRRRRSRTATNLAWALFGGLLAVGVLAFSGVFGGGSVRTAAATVSERTAANRTVADSGSGGDDLDAEALYAEAADAVVEISASQMSGAATGSGFIVDADGTVVTAAHVVEGATSVEVKLSDGTTRSAEVLGEDGAADLAVIRFDASGLELQTLTIASSADLDVGAEVAAIGAPFEYAWSISTGIVSGLDRTIEAPNGFTVAHAVQTDAAVNPGNSGGPLLNAAGEVVGVVDQIATDGSSDQSSGVGFAVPSDLVSAELEALAGGEQVEHAYLGVATGDAEGSAAGALVAEVAAGSPAAEAGIEAGATITAIDGAAIDGSEALVAAIAAHAPGDEVEIELEGSSGSRSVSVQLGSQPAQSALGG